jgi:hypothetical protein
MNKMKDQTYYTVGAILNSDRKIVEQAKLMPPKTQLHDR